MAEDSPDKPPRDKSTKLKDVDGHFPVTDGSSESGDDEREGERDLNQNRLNEEQQDSPMDMPETNAQKRDKAQDDRSSTHGAPETEEFWLLKGDLNEKDVESEPEVVHRSQNKRVRMVRVSRPKNMSDWKIGKKGREKKRSKDENDDFTQNRTYKYGKVFLIGLALFSIPIDGWKLYQGIEKSQRSLDGPSSLEVFDFYSSTISTHVLGLAAAVDNSLILTLGCRLLSTLLYQSDYSGKGNSTLPTDPQELQKYIREKVPKHRLPKGYTLPPEDAKMMRQPPPGMGRPGGTGGKKSKKGKKNVSGNKRASTKKSHQEKQTTTQSKKQTKSTGHMKKSKAAEEKSGGKKN